MPSISDGSGSTRKLKTGNHFISEYQVYIQLKSWCCCMPSQVVTVLQQTELDVCTTSKKNWLTIFPSKAIGIDHIDIPPAKELASEGWPFTYIPQTIPTFMTLLTQCVDVAILCSLGINSLYNPNKNIPLLTVFSNPSQGTSTATVGIMFRAVGWDDRAGFGRLCSAGDFFHGIKHAMDVLSPTGTMIRPGNGQNSRLNPWVSFPYALPQKTEAGWTKNHRQDEDLMALSEQHLNLRLPASQLVDVRHHRSH